MVLFFKASIHMHRKTGRIHTKMLTVIISRGWDEDFSFLFCVFLNEHKFIFLNFLLWDNYRFKCSCKKEYREIF